VVDWAPSITGFRIVRRIGRGGMGEVFEAVREGPGGFRKPVALKLLALDHALDGKAVQRFLREARISARLDHPNIVRVHDFVVEEGRHFLVMELLRGATLGELSRRAGGALPWPLALEIADQALAGLAYAHALRDEHGRAVGLVHRDLTPRNLFVCDDGAVKVLDFGIAKLRHTLAPALTEAGRLEGTLEFLAPEQAREQEVDARTDLYQLGGSSYFALAGAPPHGSGTAAQVLARVLDGAPRPLGELAPALPRAVVEWVERAMAPRPDARFVDAAAMQAALRAARGGAESGPAALARWARALPAPSPGDAPPSAAEAQAAIEAASPTGPDQAAPHAPTVELRARPPAPARESPARESPAPDLPARPAPRAGRRVALAAVVLVALSAAAGLAIDRAIRRAPPAPVARALPLPLPIYKRLTYARGTLTGARFAPGGSIVYSAAWGGRAADTFETRLSSPEARSLALARTQLVGVSARGDMALLLDPTRVSPYLARGVLVQTSLAGGVPREILENVQWADWSPAGELAVLRWTGARSTLELPAGKVLHASDVGWFGDPRISPRGDRIAFIQHPGGTFDDQGAIAVVDRAGHVETLTDVLNSAQGLAWSPDGAEIWFTATRDANYRALYAVTLAKQTRLITSTPVGLTIADIAADGRVLLVRAQEEDRVAVGAAHGEPERDLSWRDHTYVIDLSADGATVLLGEGGGDASGDDYAVYLRNADGSPPVRLAGGQPCSLSSDGKWVLAASKAADRLMLVPTGPGAVRELDLGGPRAIRAARLFPDGKRVLFVDAREHQGERLHVLDVETGALRELGPGAARELMGNPVAPDGKHVALVDAASNRLQLVALDGGAAQPLAGAEPGEIAVRFSAAGDALYVTRIGPPPLRLFRVDVKRGRRVLWREPAVADPAGILAIDSVVVTPDGARYAYTYTRALSTLFLVENLR
jgi:serine/threonine protein kinase